MVTGTDRPVCLPGVLANRLYVRVCGVLGGGYVQRFPHPVHLEGSFSKPHILQAYCIIQKSTLPKEGEGVEPA